MNNDDILHTKEENYRKLDLINFWISNVDAKISFALAFVGIFIGFVLSQGYPHVFCEIVDITLKELRSLNWGQVLSIIILLSLYLSSFICLIVFLLALKGKINDKVYKEYKMNCVSTLFFGSIANMNYVEYREKIDTLKDEELLNDITSQIYINSIICKKKFDLYNSGINLLIIAIITFGICKIFGIL